MKRICALVLVVAICGALVSAQQPQNLSEQNHPAAWFVQAAAVQTTAEAEQVEVALRQHGFAPQRTTQSQDKLIHLRIGPFTAQQAASVGDQLTALGYSAVVQLDGESASAAPPGTRSQPATLTAGQSDLEAQALAKLGGSSTAPVSASGSDLEAQALAKLGGSTTPPPPSNPVDLEAQAVQSMQTQTAKNEVEAAKRRADEEEQRRIEAEREAEEAQNSPPPETQSSGGGFLNGLNAVLGVVNQGMQQAMAQNAANSAQAMNNAAQLQAAAAAARARAEEMRRESEQIQQQLATQQSNQNSAQSASVGNGLCPNGKYVDDAAHCDCRKYSANAVYGCPSGGGPAGSKGQAGAAASNGGSNGSIFRYNPTPRPGNNPPAPSSTTSNPAPGTSQPAPCYYISDRIPCIPQSTWQQIVNAPDTYKPPTNTPTGPVQVYYIGNADIPDGPGVYWCPKSGMIHTGYYTANDAWIGQDSSCAVGFHFRISWPSLPGTTAGAGSSPGNGSSGTAGSDSGAGTGSNSGSVGSAGAGCVGVDPSVVTVKSKWAGAGSNEVVAWITNNSSEWVTCTTAFRKNGQWTDYATGSIAPGKTNGGEMGGFYTFGADSTVIRYACFAGKDPMDSKGTYCSAKF